MRPATLNTIFSYGAYLQLLLLNFVNGERTVCRRSSGPVLQGKHYYFNAKRLKARSTGRTFLKWHLTLFRECNKLGQGFSS